MSDIDIDISDDFSTDISGMGPSGDEIDAALAAAQAEETPAVAPEAQAAAPAAAPAAPAEPGEGAKLIARLAEADKRAREASEAAKGTQAKLEQYERMLQLAQTDPQRFAEAIGRPQQAAAAPAKPTQQADDVRRELAELKQRLEAREREEAQRTQLQQLTEAEQKVTDFVRQKSEEFPFTTAFGLEGAVYDRVLHSYQAGQPMSEMQAARDIEESLTGKLEALAKIPAVRDAVLKEAGQSEKPKQRRAPTTLSNSLSGTVARQADPEQLDDWEDALDSTAAQLIQLMRN